MFATGAKVNLEILSAELGVPSSINFLARITLCFFNPYKNCMAFGIPSSLTLLPKDTNKPFSRYPIKTAISLVIPSISLDRVYVGGRGEGCSARISLKSFGAKIS